MPLLKDLPIGSLVYDVDSLWEHKSGNSYTGTGEIKPVVWRVVAHNHFKAGATVLFADKIVAKYRFGSRNTPWNDTGTTDSIRNGFLRTTFYNHLSTEFKSNIEEVTTFTQGQTNYNETVFLPSWTELKNNTSYLLAGSHGTYIPYFDKVNKLYDSTRWWTRSGNNAGGAVRVVTSDGNENNPPPTETDIGVKPMVNLKSSVEALSNGDGTYSLFKSRKGYLVKDGNNIKKYNNNQWQTIGVTPVTSEMFILHGMEKPPIFTEDVLKSLVSDKCELLFWKDTDSVSVKVKKDVHGWATVSSTLPTSEQFMSDGIDDLSPLTRQVTTLEPLIMTDKSEVIQSNENGKVFSKKVNLKKYFDIRNISIEGRK